MSFIRARNDDQKQIRIQNIIEAAERLYEKYEYDEITFALIAKEASFTRSNLYKYFDSKEEIYLKLISDDLHLLIGNFAAQASGKTLNSKEFADFLTKTYLSNKRSLSLLSILYTSLEKNASFEKLLTFKKNILEDIAILGGVIVQNFPSFSEQDVEDFIHQQIALAIGLYPMSNPTQNQLDAITHSELNLNVVNFEDCFSKAIKNLLDGLLAR